MTTGAWLAAAGGVLVGLALGAVLARRPRAATAGPPPDREPPAPAVEAPEVEPEDEAVGELLRAVVDDLDNAVVLHGPDGTELYRNAEARRLAEARDGRVLVAAAVEDLLAEAAEGGHRTRRVVDLIGPPVASFVVVAAPIRLRGDGPAAGGTVAVVEDRSLARRTETVRRDFVANISHELKTPIGALGLLAETLRDEVGAPGPDGPTVQRLADRVIAEADRAAATVDDLLELSRIEFGDDADRVEVAVADVVDEAVARLAPAAEHAGISVRPAVEPDLVVVGDRRQLVSAVVNLLDNAIKYSPSGSEVDVGGTRDGDRARVVVADRGVGVPRRDLDRIFERFYRVDRARSRGTGGTGLGLAIVRHVASNHGGEVMVTSTEGVGSTFTLVLPVGRGRSARPPAGGSRPVAEAR